MMHSMLDIPTLVGLPPPVFDMQRLLIEGLADIGTSEPTVMAPDIGLGRRVAWDIHDPRYDKVVQLYSEIRVANAPMDGEGYSDIDLTAFDGVVVGDVVLDNSGDITFFNGNSMSYDVFVEMYVPDMAVKNTLDQKMTVLRKYAGATNALIKHADEMWVTRAAGVDDLVSDQYTIC